jgi:hypothetical protein
MRANGAFSFVDFLLERDDFSSNRHPALSFCLSMISAQTLRVCREGKPVPTFPDHALEPKCRDSSEAVGCGGDGIATGGAAVFERQRPIGNCAKGAAAEAETGAIGSGVDGRGLQCRRIL